MAETQDVETLKRRGRRRLVGAIALVLVAVIVLPMVFDAEPKRVPPVSVRIPSEDDPGFKPKVVPKSPAVVPAPEPIPRDEPKLQSKPEPKPEPKPELKPAPAAPSEAEPKRAEAALAGAQLFIVPVAALATEEKLKELTDTLSGAKLPYYTEPVATAKGKVTRVRAGPFPNREAAEQALKQLTGLGLKPGKIVTR